MLPNQDSASEMLRRLRLGEDHALHELYGLLRRPVYLLAFSILRNTADAEDILQDTFLTVYTKSGSYRQRQSPEGWVLRIARNKALNLLRYKRSHPSVDITELELASEAVGEASGDLFERCLTLLNTRQRQIMVLHLTLDLTHKQTAQILALPEGTVRRTYADAIRHLRDQLDREEYYS